MAGETAAEGAPVEGDAAAEASGLLQGIEEGLAVLLVVGETIVGRALVLALGTRVKLWLAATPSKAAWQASRWQPTGTRLIASSARRYFPAPPPPMPEAPT